MNTKYWLAVFMTSFGIIGLRAVQGSERALCIFVLMVLALYGLFRR